MSAEADAGTDVEDDDGDDFPDQAEQKRELLAAEEAVEGFRDDTAKRVIFAWFSRLGLGAPFVIDNGPDVQTTFCTICSTGPEPVEADFYWKGWGSLCAHCSVMQWKHGDDNPRRADVAEWRRSA